MMTEVPPVPPASTAPMGRLAASPLPAGESQLATSEIEPQTGGKTGGRPRPRPSKTRIVGLDLARGLAILGMFTSHFYIAPGGGFLDYLVAFAHGRSSILFSLLAGISVGILSGGARAAVGTDLLTARIRIATRAVLLMLIVALVSLINVRVALILSYYALWFLLAIPFLRVRPRNLLIAAGVMGLCGAAVGRAVGVYLPAVNLAAAHGVEVSADQVVFVYLFTGSYPGVIWMAFILAGLAIARLDIRAALTRKRLALAAVGLIIAGYGGATLATSLQYGRFYQDFLPVDPGSSMPAPGNDGGDILPPGGKFQSGQGLKPGPGTGTGTGEPRPYATLPPGGPGMPGGPGGSWGSWGSGSADADAPGPVNMPLVLDFTGFMGTLGASYLSASPHSGGPFEVFGSGGVAILIVVALVSAPIWFTRLLTPLAALGSMSLTAYCLQLPWLSYVALNGLSEEWSLLGLIVVMLAAATAWRHWVGRGPLEWLLHEASVALART